ncbi:general odorant-binding protein 19d isoform X2 [Amyelois transitella]|uniref:general odorant-binding protein 19d isoform X2 n=1 Tax=Amyelois transitella TaxID=680683 RepID=UPI00067B9587|nr:general odorant-binding protein 19d isoform X2 [Amyelois transitella]
MLRLFLVVCFVVSSQARTPEEIKKWFLQLGMECNNEHPISPDEMVMLQKHKIPESENVKCLMACVFRKPKWLSESGTFDIDAAEKMIDKEYGDDNEKKTNAKKLFDECRSVNTAAVSDGTAGCERSYLLTECLIEHAPKFGFDLKHVQL